MGMRIREKTKERSVVINDQKVRDKKGYLEDIEK